MKFRMKVIDKEGKKRKATVKAPDENAALELAKANGLFPIEVEVVKHEPEVGHKQVNEILAIQPCRDCGGKVSTEAQVCPHCGAGAPAREKSVDWVPCPKCGSAKTQKIGPGLLGFASFAMGGCLLWIPIFGWILAPFFLLGAVFLWVSALLPSGKISFLCQSCKQWFQVPKSELGVGGREGIKQAKELTNSTVRIAVAIVVLTSGLGILALYLDNTDKPPRSPRSTRPANKRDAKAIISSTVLSEEVDESPGKTMIKMDVLVPEQSKENELRMLLKSLCAKASARTGFQYHTHPTVIGIYAYPSREHAESGTGQWVAMLTKTPAESEPKIHINFSVNREVAVEESRFGYSEDERKEIFRRIVIVEDTGRKEAGHRYPSELQRQFDYADELTDKYKNELAKELKLSVEQLKEIGREGLMDNWAMPP